VAKFFSILLAVVMMFTAFDAEAKRMGGGKSMGRQSSNVTQREAARTPAAPGNQAATAGAAGAAGAGAAAAAKKPWGAMLGGLAAGLGLAWLASSLGLGEGFANILMIALLAMAAFAVFRMIKNRSAGAQGNRMAYQGAGAGPTGPVPTPNGYNPSNVGNDAAARPWENPATNFSNAGAAGAGAAGGSIIGSALGGSGSGLGGSQTWGVPADFDTDGFLAAAKRNFVTLQSAWDRSDISALRAMMTDGMLSEIQAQLTEREQTAAGQPNHTDVVKVDAQLLGIEELPTEYLASVEFNGLIREEVGAAPTPFREVWNMVKPKNGGGWLVAGVQALQ
jgi:predicted lipid-binding transport protein (Tim44 family)